MQGLIILLIVLEPDADSKVQFQSLNELL